MNRVFGFLTLLLALAWSNTASADLIVSIGSIDLAPGQTGSIELMISGSNAPLSIFGFDLRIVPQAGATSSLRFLEEDESYLSRADYVFKADSSALGDKQDSSVGRVSTTVLPGDTFRGVDATLSLGDVFVTDARLLARIPVQHFFAPAAADTTLGHRFAIELVSPSGTSLDFTAGQAATGFADKAFAPIEYNSKSGFVTISAVPEPNSFGLGWLVTCCVLCKWRRSRDGGRVGRSFGAA